MPSVSKCSACQPAPSIRAGEIIRASGVPSAVTASTTGKASCIFHFGDSVSSIYMKASVESGAEAIPARNCRTSAERMSDTASAPSATTR